MDFFALFQVLQELEKAAMGDAVFLHADSFPLGAGQPLIPEAIQKHFGGEG
jgi:hypothetical protein